MTDNVNLHARNWTSVEKICYKVFCVKTSSGLDIIIIIIIIGPNTQNSIACLTDMSRHALQIGVLDYGVE